MFSLAKNSRKRKAREVAPPPSPHQINLFNRRFASSPAAPPIGRRRQSQVQHILNRAAPFKPFSFTSLLTTEDEYEDEDEDDLNSLSPDMENKTEEIDDILFLHSEIVKQELVDMLRKDHYTVHGAAEERAAKKLKEMELELRLKSVQTAELERMAEHYKAKMERLQIRAEYLKRMAMCTRACLKDSRLGRRRYAETGQEAESKGPAREGMVRLDCTACEKQPATVMMWPCRHVCICKKCDAVTRVCPVCFMIKCTSVEVFVSAN